MRTAARTPNPYPHVRLRLVHGRSEAYLPGTGLSVWEVGWLARVYEGDVEAVGDHLSLDARLVREAMEYAQDHAAEIDSAIAVLEEASEDRLRSLLPGLRVVTTESASDLEATS